MRPSPAHRFLSTACFVALLGPSTAAHSAAIECTPADYRSVLPKLKPGDELVLAPGTYTRGLPLSDMSGTADQPIVIRGPDDRMAIFKADDCCNTVQLQNASHIEIHNLTLDGSGTNGAFGVDSRGPTHHITLENLRIVNYGADQQVVGISTKGPAWNWVIRRNTIVGAGTGMYLGNSDGTAPFVNGLIEYNVVVDTIGYNLQIKHQLPRPTDVGLPTGESRTIIRHNVWSKQSGSSTDANARPNVLVGHFPVTGAGATDRYEIYGNFFYQNSGESLFQGEGNIVLHDNVFVNHFGDAIRVVPHNDKPRAVTIYHNTVVARGTGIWLAGGDPAYEQAIVANAVFASLPIGGSRQKDNITAFYANAPDFLVAPAAPLGALDLRPKPGKLIGTPLDPAPFSTFADGNLDFDGNDRNGASRGAYEAGTTGSHWQLALATKPAVKLPAAAPAAPYAEPDPATANRPVQSTNP